jgi:hypothetical protein
MVGLHGSESLTSLAKDDSDTFNIIHEVLNYRHHHIHMFYINNRNFKVDGS